MRVIVCMIEKEHPETLKIDLSHISLAFLLWNIGKQCRSRSDAAERGVWSGSLLFANRMFYQKLTLSENITQQPLNRKWTGPIDKGMEIRLKWVNNLYQQSVLP